MASVSGLGGMQRLRARDLAVEAALLGLRRAPSLRYTQGPSRWEGIARHLKAWQNECPRNGDCSAFATWCLWNGLDHFGVRDTVNGQRWRAGYTGTMVNHGKRVRDRGNVVRGDLVLYGDPFGRTGHVAIVVGARGGRGPAVQRGRPLLVVSFGSDAGPYLLRADYRPIAQIRRYI